jgi:hypothetical protein
MKNSTITTQAKQLCEFALSYSDKPAMHVTSAQALFATTLLKNLSSEIDVLINPSIKDKLKLSYSQGCGSFPKILWIAYTPIGKRVSNSASVCICFARDGKGMVAGMMAPAVGLKNITTIKRSHLVPDILNINGYSPATKYNDQFVNPKEFYIDTLNIDNLISHINNSIKNLHAALKSNSINFDNEK